MRIDFFPSPDFSPEGFMDVAVGDSKGTLCGVYVQIDSRSETNIKLVRSLIKGSVTKDTDFAEYADHRRCGVYHKTLVRSESKRRRIARRMTAALSDRLMLKLHAQPDVYIVDKEKTRKAARSVVRDVTILTLNIRKRSREETPASAPLVVD
eukprot:5228604-Prymnesium_polylepis.3